MGAGDKEKATQETHPDAGLRIFISYRRDDTPDAAGRLYDSLVARFGSNVFMDVDTIEPGLDFVEVLNNAVASCDVLIALIGRGWLTSTDANGRRRLNNPEDFVRLEIEAALKREVRVIPVLLHGVEMPASDELPDSLTALARRNALQLDYSRWRDDVRRLLLTLERLQTRRSEQAEPRTQEQADVQAKEEGQPPPRKEAEKEETQQGPHEPLEKEGREGPVEKSSRRRVWIALAAMDALAVLALAVTAANSQEAAVSVGLVLGPAGLGWALARASNRRVKVAVATTILTIALVFAVWAVIEQDANAAAAVILVVGGLAVLGWSFWRAVLKARAE